MPNRSTLPADQRKTIVVSTQLNDRIDRSLPPDLLKQQWVDHLIKVGLRVEAKKRLREAKQLAS